MFRFFSLSKWSRLEKSLEQKPNILVSQFSIIGIIATIIQILNDALSLNPVAVGLDSVIILILIATFSLNENRRHLLAKFILIVVGTGFIFFYAAIVPKSIGIYLIFFPMITIIFLVFSNEEQQYKYISVIFVLSLLSILEISAYQPFGSFNVTEGKSEDSSFQVNLLISIFVMIFSVYNMEEINKEIEKKRTETLAKLEEKNEELRQTNEELDHFVYSASHDLKAPLSSILGLINIAKYEVKDDKIQDYFVKIENRVERLSTFIKEVIEISRNSRTQLRPEEIDLKSLIEVIIENNNYAAGIDTIDFEIDIKLERVFISDQARVEVILNNLISNAIKYADFRKSNPFVKFKVRETANHYQLTVYDNGIGIAEKHQKKVFEMFYRGLDTGEGSGLGLYIVNNMLEKLKGKITLKSKLNEGTTINLQIPKQKMEKA